MCIRDSNLGFDLAHAGLDGVAVALAADDGGVVLVDADLLALAEHAEVGVLELVALLLADDGATGEDGDVFEHFFAAVAVLCLSPIEETNCRPGVLRFSFFAPSSWVLRAFFEKISILLKIN